jgi:hypothetical protein
MVIVKDGDDEEAFRAECENAMDSGAQELLSTLPNSTTGL